MIRQNLYAIIERNPKDALDFFLKASTSDKEVTLHELEVIMEYLYTIPYILHRMDEDVNKVIRTRPIVDDSMRYIIPNSMIEMTAELYKLYLLLTNPNSYRTIDKMITDRIEQLKLSHKLEINIFNIEFTAIYRDLLLCISREVCRARLEHKLDKDEPLVYTKFIFVKCRDGEKAIYNYIRPEYISEINDILYGDAIKHYGSIASLYTPDLKHSIKNSTVIKLIDMWDEQGDGIIAYPFTIKLLMNTMWQRISDISALPLIDPTSIIKCVSKLRGLYYDKYTDLSYLASFMYYLRDRNTRALKNSLVRIFSALDDSSDNPDSEALLEACTSLIDNETIESFITQSAPIVPYSGYLTKQPGYTSHPLWSMKKGSTTDFMDKNPSVMNYLKTTKNIIQTNEIKSAACNDKSILYKALEFDGVCNSSGYVYLYKGNTVMVPVFNLESNTVDLVQYEDGNITQRQIIETA